MSQTASGLVAWLFPSVRLRNFYFISQVISNNHLMKLCQKMQWQAIAQLVL
ncbi:MAG: hypothetical protein HC939_12395 [Pleurocapsa sp. SU_5_0]|nr:hypothetical protein [Pleurocapsa sp. SU_5_0]